MIRKLPQPQAGSKKFSAASLLWKGLQFRLPPAFRAGEDGRQFRLERVEKQRADHFQNVVLRRVMRADGPSLGRIHHALEQRAEDGGGDARPIELRAGQQGRAHG